MINKSKTISILGLEISSDVSEQPLIKQWNILVLILISFTVFNYIFNGLFRPLSTDKTDFNAYYNAAIAIKHGFPLYDLMIRFFKEGLIEYKGPVPYVYPPCFAIFLSPLAYLSYKKAAVCWLLLNHVLFISGFILLLKAVSRRYSLIELLTLVIVCLNFTPLFIDYLIGQSNIILFFLIILGFYLFRTKQDVYAGIVFAVACVIKVIPLLLLVYMLWKRHYTLFVSACMTMLFLFIYSLLFFDVELYIWYFKFMINENTFAAFHDNHSLTGFFSRLFVHSIWVKGVINNPLFAQICIIGSTGFVLIIFLYVTRKSIDRSDDRTLHEFGLAVITMLLISKMTSTPYLVMLLVPIGILVREMFQLNIYYKWIPILAISYGILAIWYPLSVGKFLDMDTYKIYTQGFPSLIFSVQFFALLMMWSYFSFGAIRYQIRFDKSKTTKIG